MENKAIARTLRLYSQLMELHNENSFKVKSLANSAFKVDKLPYTLSKKSLKEMEAVDGLGKSTAAKIWELIETNAIAEMETLMQNTPIGILEILQLKGVGPKKVLVIWKDLGIESVGELYYACNENRLIEAKGFGLKTQEEIKKIIEFKMASLGRYLYARIEDFAENLITSLKESFQTEYLLLTGDYRRRCEIIEGLDILLVANLDDSSLVLIENNGLTIKEKKENTITCNSADGIAIYITFCNATDFGWELLKTTGNAEHVAEIEKLNGSLDTVGKSETEIYALTGLKYIEPELREGKNETQLAKENRLPTLLDLSDLKGTIHNHSTWSDGVHTIEEMAIYCRDELNLQYLGMSDHSKSAFYASGLNEIRVAAQQREIDELNKKLAPFHIFKGIESDILYDGSLDYSNDVLASFDFVVASIHSVLKMSEEKATERLIKAIENPYTTFLGHPTGRMLLTRSGYSIDHKKVIDACADNNVIIEINANPLRLDIDWRWHQYAIEKGVMLSVNPDAHRITGFNDMHYGVLVARKGGVEAKDCLNAMSLEDVKVVFGKRKAIQCL